MGLARRVDLPRLTSLRCFAAVAVFLFHANEQIGWKPLHVFAVGGAGVTFFFVLSGFVLAWSMRPGLPARRFYLNRFARIWPAATVMLFVAVLVSATIMSTPLRTGLRPFLASLFYVQAWFPSDGTAFGYNGVEWTLSVEAAFYLLFPVLVPIMRGWSAKVQVAVVIAGLTGQAIALVGLANLGLHTVAYTNPLIHLPSFLAGVVLALQVKAGWRPPIGVGAAVAVFVALAAVARASAKYPVSPLVLLPAFLLLIATAAAADLAGTSGLLTRRWMVYLGEVSFCFFLTHWLVLRMIAPAAGWNRSWSLVGGSVPTAAVFAVSLVAAVVLHHVVERPAQRWIVTRSRRSAIGVAP